MSGLPEIAPGDDLIKLLSTCDPKPVEGDIMVVTQKVVSKAEGRLVKLDTVEPSAKATEIAAKFDKHPGLVELVLQESQELLRWERGVLISRTREGFVCANAGIDLSNVDGGETACLLPLNCDLSAKRLCQGLSEHFGFRIPVVISDSFGRPWRTGITNVALGSFGIEVLLDHRGTHDSFGMEMKATVIAVADALAAATELVVGKTTGFGATLIRGYDFQPSDTSGVNSSIRPWEHCLFV